MDLYDQMPADKPLKSVLPKDAARVAIVNCNRTPYRIIVWKRLLNFLLVDGLSNHDRYERLAFTLPAGEDALKAWTYCTVNYAANSSWRIRRFQTIIIRVENPSPSEKEDIDKWSPADVVSTVIGA